MTVSVAENLVRPELPSTLTDFLQTAMVKPMIRRFDFASLQGKYSVAFYISDSADLSSSP